jgi:hypothetical protein
MFRAEERRMKMTEFTRLSPQETRQRVTSGSALLVCAYEDDEKCNRLRLEGAISLTEFKSKVSGLSKDEEIIFYCA